MRKQDRGGVRLGGECVAQADETGACIEHEIGAGEIVTDLDARSIAAILHGRGGCPRHGSTNPPEADEHELVEDDIGNPFIWSSGDSIPMHAPALIQAAAESPGGGACEDVGPVGQAARLTSCSTCPSRM